MLNRRLDSNESAERSYPERRRHGYEEGKRGANIVVTAGNIMAQLMRAQYREQCKGEECSVKENSRMPQCPENRAELHIL